MAINDWWQSLPGELYWLETTNRSDLGTDLNAPTADERGVENWSYVLIKYVENGDIVFHYEIGKSAITAWSVARGKWWTDQVYWGSRAFIGNRMGVEPYVRPGLRLALEGPFPLSNPLTLADLRNHEGDVRNVREQLLPMVGGALYFPFELSEKRPMRTGQAYLTKFPRALVSVFPVLEAAVKPIEIRSRTVRARLGAPYRRADEEAAVAKRDPFEVDPDLVDRGVRGHATTQNALADLLQSLGVEPRKPSPSEPFFDLAWEREGAVSVAEVKSLTDANEERQLRLGLGQVLRYQHVLRQSYPVVKAVLAVERQPSDMSWDDLCREAGVLLVWPDNMAQRLWSSTV